MKSRSMHERANIAPDKTRLGTMHPAGDLADLRTERRSRSLVESCKVNRVNPLTYLTYILSHVRDPRVTLLTPDEYAERNTTDLQRIG